MSKEKKKSNALIIAVCICCFILAVLLLVFAFADTVIGNIRLENVRDGAYECDSVIISSPLHSQGITRGAEATLDGDKARELADKFIEATEHTSFDELADGSKGFWHTKLTFISGDESFTVYLKDDEIYVTGKNAYIFEIDDSCENKYSELYDTVTSILDNVK